MNENEQNAIDIRRKKVEQIGISQSNSSDTESNAVDLNTLWHTVKRGKWIILGTCLAMVAAFTGYTFLVAPEYEAASTVQVEKPNQTETVRFDIQPELENEIGILANSGSLAMRVVKELRTVADTADTPFQLFEAVDDESPTDDDVMERLFEMVEFTAESEQNLIRIVARSQHPEEAAAIANIYADAYRSYSRESARAGVTAARDFLETQLEQREEDISEVESEWQEFARRHSVAIDGQDGNRVANDYVEMMDRRDELEFQLQEEQRTLDQLITQLGEAEGDFRGDVEGEQSVQSMQNRINALDEQIADLEAQAEPYYINNPDLRGNESQVSELSQIKTQMEGLESRKERLTTELIELASDSSVQVGQGAALGRLTELRTRIDEQESTVRQLEGQVDRLNERIENHEGRIEQIPEQTVQREQLARRLDQAEQFYQDIAMELQRTIVTEESELGYVEVIRSASIPVLPVSPNLHQNIILGLLLGLAFGVGGAFVRQAMNWQIYDPEDIQRQGFSLVGVIPDMKREIKNSFDGQESMNVDGRELSTSLMPLLNPWSPITENYRLIRTNLQFAQANDDVQPEVLMITSPESGDGKSTTSVNLAITIALSGRKVLLIDADLRRPTTHKLLGVDRSPGLAEMLVDSAQREIVQRTFIENLYHVPAGTVKVPPTELLDSARMRQLVALGRSRCDVVIIDTPPVMGATDALVVSSLCDAVLVVAAANKTDVRSLNSVKETFNGVNVPLAGVIFNRFDASKSQGSHTYGYGYDETYPYAPTTDA
ncbi:MAG: polysaccharide biosynthesis tyrosine autokinase [Bacteroidota bacterium]